MRKTLLIYEPSLRRIEPDLVGLSSQLDLRILREDGSLDAGGPVQIAWSNGDLYNSPHFSLFNRLMMESPSLEWVQTAAAGLDNPLFGAILARGVRLTSGHAQAEAIAEYVLHAALDYFQRGPARRAAQAAIAWERLRFTEIAGSRWLIVGFGAIGQAIAARARPFGARIVGIRQHAVPHHLADEIDTLTGINAHLPYSDIVVLALPLKPTSRGLAGAAFFEKMKRGSLLINVSRGAILDEAALLQALAAGAPQFAALDVFAVEPLPIESALWTHPQIAVTAHASSLGSGLQARGDAHFLRNVNQYIAGEKLMDEVRAADT